MQFDRMKPLLATLALTLALTACLGDTGEGGALAGDDGEGTDTGAADDGAGEGDDAGDDAGASEDFEEVTLMVVSNNTHIAAMAAAEQGLWIEQGLDVNLVVLDSGREIMTAVGAGEADFGGVNAANTIPPARAGGLDVSVVVPYMNDALHTAHVGRVSFIARDDSGIDADDPSTVAGTTIGVLEASTTDHYILNWLDRHDLAPSDVEFVNMPVPDMAVAIQQGLVDAVVPWEPYASQILREQDDVFAVERGGDYVADVIGIATSNELVEENPELIEKFVVGVVEGAQWVRQNPEEAAEVLLSYIGGAELEDVIEGNALTAYDPRVSVCTEEGVMTAAQSLIDAGEIEADPFEIGDLLNVEILNRVVEERPEFFEDLEPLPESLDECL